MSSSYFPDYQRMDLLDLQAAHLAACDQYEQLVNRQVALYQSDRTNPVAQREANNAAVAAMQRIDDLEALIAAAKEVEAGNEPPRTLQLFGRVYELSGVPF